MHPEAVDVFVFKDEEHAVFWGEVVSEHEACFAVFGGLCDFDCKGGVMNYYSAGFAYAGQGSYYTKESNEKV